jgi:hypothetical protein
LNVPEEIVPEKIWPGKIQGAGQGKVKAGALSDAELNSEYC